jgi:hypothetical protein
MAENLYIFKTILRCLDSVYRPFLVILSIPMCENMSQMQMQPPKEPAAAVTRDGRLGAVSVQPVSGSPAGAEVDIATPEI